MTKYVALLRGINVGGNNKVEMAKLKKCFESLGYANVVTYINSGNIIFEAKKMDTQTLVREIERVIKKTFGFEVRVVVRDNTNIQKLCKSIPVAWENNAEQRTDVLFLWDAYDAKKSIELIPRSHVDTLKYFSGAIIWNLERSNYAKTGMRKFIGSVIYKHMTARNVNTVRKLAKLMEKKS